jgi:hypothetical protein
MSSPSRGNSRSRGRLPPHPNTTCPHHLRLSPSPGDAVAAARDGTEKSPPPRHPPLLPPTAPFPKATSLDKLVTMATSSSTLEGVSQVFDGQIRPLPERI